MKVIFVLLLSLIISCTQNLRAIDIELAMDNSIARNASLVADANASSLLNGLRQCELNGTIEIAVPSVPITNDIIVSHNCLGNFSLALDSDSIPFFNVPLAIKPQLQETKIPFISHYWIYMLLFIGGCFIKYIWRFIKWGVLALVTKGPLLMVA